MHPGELTGSSLLASFKVIAITQLIKSFSLFDEALLPGRGCLVANAWLWSKVAKRPLSVEVEDLAFMLNSLWGLLIKKGILFTLIQVSATSVIEVLCIFLWWP